MYLRAQPTEGGLRIQSYSHSLTTEFMGDWSPATPTGLNTSHDYQPDGLVVWPYEGIYIGIGNVFNTADTVAASGAIIGQVNMVLGWSAGDHDRLRRQAPSLAGLLRCSHRRRCGGYRRPALEVAAAERFDHPSGRGRGVRHLRRFRCEAGPAPDDGQRYDAPLLRRLQCATLSLSLPFPP